MAYTECAEMAAVSHGTTTSHVTTKQRCMYIIIIIHSFYIALFSALEQTHCAHWHVILNECILLIL